MWNVQYVSDLSKYCLCWKTLTANVCSVHSDPTEEVLVLSVKVNCSCVSFILLILCYCEIYSPLLLICLQIIFCQQQFAFCISFQFGLLHCVMRAIHIMRLRLRVVFVIQSMSFSHLADIWTGKSSAAWQTRQQNQFCPTHCCLTTLMLCFSLIPEI